VVGVDLGDDERDVGSHAEGGGVGDDGAASGGEAGLEVAGDGSVNGGKNDAGQVWTCGLGRVGLEDHLCDAGGEGRVQTPGAGFGVGFAGAAVAGGQPGDVEPGVVFEKLDESLSDHAGRAENAYVMPFHMHLGYRKRQGVEGRA